MPEAEWRRLEEECIRLEEEHERRWTPERRAKFDAEGRALREWKKRERDRKAKGREPMSKVIFVLWAVTVILFFLAWPAGLALAAFLIFFGHKVK